MDRGRLRGHRQLTRLAVPHLDNRMIIIRSGQTTPRRKYSATRPTTLTSWRRLPSSLQDGIPLRNRLDDSVDKAELIDCYRRTRHDVDTSSRGLVSRGLADHRRHQLGPEGALGSRFAFFSDPDGNGWSIQEFKR
jgi:hypothetical protein